MLKLILSLSIFLLASQSLASDTSSLLKEADEIRSTNLSKFIDLLERIERGKDSLSNSEKLKFKYLSAYKMSFSGNPIEAIKIYEQVLRESTNTELKVRALASIVNTHALTRNFEKGYSRLDELIQLINISSGETRHGGLVVLSIFYNQAEEFELGLNYAKMVSEDNPNLRTLCFSKNLENEARYHLKIDGDIEKIEETITLCEEQGELAASGMAVLWKAKRLDDSEKSLTALELLNNKRKIIEASDYPRLASEYHSIYSKLSFQMKDYSSAEENAKKAIVLAKNMGFTKPLVLAYEVLYKIAFQAGKVDESLSYYKKYAEADKAYLDELKVKQLAIQQAKHDAMEKANQIALLDKENTLLKTQAKLSKEKQENNRLFMAFLMLVIMMVVLWAYKNRRMHLKIRQQAETDDLTGISNRGHFSQVAESALSYHKKTHQPLAFVIFDLDLFKNVNDQFGHQVGDWALKAAVDALKRVCREQDQIGRMGGEEFAILLPGCSIGKAMQVAEACRLAIEAIDTSPSGEHFTLTASFGVADTQVCGYEFDQLYGCADKALYQSKENGRNRVYRYIQEAPNGPLYSS